MKINKYELIMWPLIISLLYWVSTFNYLFFHGLAEIFSICIAFTVFILTWNSRQYLNQNYLVLMGIAYLFIGLLDLFHTLSYKGMSIFPDYDYYANQVWIATRFMESITLLLSMFILRSRKKTKVFPVLIVYTAVTAAILLSVFVLRIFPVCFIEGKGLTQFKKISEYVICLILLASLVLLKINRRHFIKKIYLYLFFAILFTVFSELAFTFYVSNYGFSNLVGHFFKIASFYMIYKAIIEEGIREPYNIIFKELKDKENIILRKNNELLKLSRQDSMTRLYNHEYLLSTIQIEIERCKRFKHDMAVIMFDLDNFKETNDTWGHLKGDEILVKFAEIIRTSIRKTDIAGRYGGEEFLIVLPETDIKKGVLVAEKIRKKIADSFKHPKVTVSGGVASYRYGLSLEDLISKADKRLYVSKAGGKNRITGP